MAGSIIDPDMTSRRHSDLPGAAIVLALAAAGVLLLIAAGLICLRLT